ncbi:unnamed protein product [Leptosia nina]|uniref:SH3 domain-binding glutamic acid-rich protein n=1 Tax=Leptosia nina TaxID=320188 RepID=A0AAV1JZB2_9NEOP
MVVKVYISGISGNKEVKKRQQRVLMILDSKTIKYEVIDITEPGREEDKDFMQNNAKCNGGTVSDPNPRSPLPPQVFNDEEYCGDYDQFDLANEVDTLEQFLKLEPPSAEPQGTDHSIVNGSVKEEIPETPQSNGKLNEAGDTEEKVVESEVSNESEDRHDAKPTSDDTPSKESSVEKETPTDRLQPEETEESSKDENKESNLEDSKEESVVNDENVNENGAVSSREQSKEKEVPTVETKDNPSEALIESEKAVAAE